MEDTDTKSQLPVHVILGASDHKAIKMPEPQRTGAIGDPVVEHTFFGWTLMSPGTEAGLNNMFLAQTASNDCEELYWMDISLSVPALAAPSLIVVFSKSLEVPYTVCELVLYM